MKTAAEVCRDFLEYAKAVKHEGEEHCPGYVAILHEAQEVVNAAYESGELERVLEAGDQLDTGLFFRGHKVIIEITGLWPPGRGRYRESVLRKQFISSMKKHCSWID